MEKPAGLFKYLDSKRIDIFEQRLVLLTPPIYFNDPWDFLPESRQPSEAEILKVWLEDEQELAKTSVIHLPVDFAERQKMRRLQELRNWAASQEFAEGLPSFSQNIISSKVGVVSLTENPLCRLMWAHYAESHRGFVAEFAVQSHFEAHGLSNCACNIGPARSAGKVKYPKPFRLNAWTQDNIVDCIFSKHPTWEYEQEWRILFPLEGGLRVKLPDEGETKAMDAFCLRFEPENLTRVIFGMRMQKEIKSRLRVMLGHDHFKHVKKEVLAIDPKGELFLKPSSESDACG